MAEQTLEWQYFEPKYEYEQSFFDLGWPWSGHKYFAYDLIRNIEPNLVVELGTLRGTSLFSISQAIKDEKLSANIYAVDTWKGDEHTGYYNNEVWKSVNEIKRKYYKDLNIHLVRSTFDEAIVNFEDKSIDVLHIDGLHTYEAVKHDFENWLQKVHNNGIILFHDINVGEADFGVYKLWDELKRKYITVEFTQSFGLGVLFKNKAMGETFAKYNKKWQMHYSYINELNKNVYITNSETIIRNLNLDISNLNKINTKNSREIITLTSENEKREQIIRTIRSAKFFKVWQIISKFKKNVGL